MQWVEPKHKREVVNHAARVLTNPEEFGFIEADNAYSTVGNWRASHSFPLNTFKIGLLRKAKLVDPDAIIAQRLKRLSSISDKLLRFEEMKLSQMQDIAGCRAILASVKEVAELVALYKRSDLKHQLIHQDDYIAAPKESGYRGVHLIYRYFSDKKNTYNGLKVEMQFRSSLQHAWATAVETVGTFIQQALKSSQGEQDWLRFFALMGTEIANRENSAPVPNTPLSKDELKEALRHYANLLQVEDHLTIYAEALNEPDRTGVQQGAHYFLLELDPAAKRVKVTGYKSGEIDRASSDYLIAERRSGNAVVGKTDAVLVSVDSFADSKEGVSKLLFGHPSVYRSC